MYTKCLTNQVLTKAICPKNGFSIPSFQRQVIRAKNLIKKATQEKKTSESTVAAAAIFKRKTLGTKLNML